MSPWILRFAQNDRKWSERDGRERERTRRERNEPDGDVGLHLGRGGGDGGGGGGGGRSGLVGDDDVAALAEPIETFEDDGVAWVDALGDGLLRAAERTEDNVANGRFVVLVDDVNIGAAGAELDGGGRDHDGVFEGADAHADVDELVGEEAFVVVGKFGLEAERAGGGIDLVIEGFQEAGGEDGGFVAIPGFDDHRLARLVGFEDGGEIDLGDGERDGNRTRLSDDDDAIGVGLPDEIAGVDPAQTGAAGDGGFDAGVGELQPGVVDLGLIGGDGALALGDERLLDVELLLRDEVLRVEISDTLEIAAGAFEAGDVLAELSFGLGEADAVGCGIDFGEHGALFDALTFFEGDAEELAVDLGFDGDGIERGDAADGLEMNGQVFAAGGDGAHGHLQRVFGAGPRGLWIARALRIRAEPEIPCGNGKRARDGGI